MNPKDSTELKSEEPDIFSTSNLMRNLAIYALVGMAGTLISLTIMLLPRPIL